MRVDVIMPQLGESVVEGLIVKWLVAPGDVVAKDQPLVEISTDKVDAEIPSPSDGTVVEILAKEKDVVPVKAVIARIETEKGAEAQPPPEPPKPAWDEESEGAPGAMARGTAPPIPAAPRGEEPPREIPPPPPSAAPGGRVRMTPVVARMAAEYGLDLSVVPGTGIDGRITKRDLERFIAAGGAAAPRPAAPTFPAGAVRVPAVPVPAAFPPVAGPKVVVNEGDQVVPWTPIRKKIAEHMLMSKHVAPHVYTFAEVDMHRVAAFRDLRKKEGVSLTFLPFVIWAAVRAIKEFPVMNASVMGESTVLRRDIHMGVAVETDRGLMVPVVRNAGRMTLNEIGQAVEGLSARARDHKITPDELSGGTFSVSNPGTKGNLFGTPIINQPQVGILRMGQVVKRAVVVDAGGQDAIVIRPMMYLALSYDHRVIDGVTGNGFLYRVREILETGDFASP